MPSLTINQTKFAVGLFDSDNTYIYKNTTSPQWYVPHGVMCDLQATGEMRTWYAGGADSSSGYTGSFTSPAFTGVAE